MTQFHGKTHPYVGPTCLPDFVSTPMCVVCGRNMHTGLHAYFYGLTRLKKIA